MLIERKDSNFLYGYTKQYFYVKAKGLGDVGEVVDVTIDEVLNNEVLGHVS